MPITLDYAEPPTAVASAPSSSGLTQPEWLRLPNADDLARYYPVEAAKNHVEGRSTVRCKVGADGRLMDCEVESEEPADAGFGAAAVALALNSFKMLPKTKNGGSAAGGTIRLPIRFVLPPPAAASPSPQQAEPGPVSFELTTTGPKAFKWLDKPNAQEMAIAMVKYSSVRSGRVVLFCRVAASGRLDACRVDSEVPSKLGLAASALSLTPIFRIAPTTADGGSVAGGTLSIPFHFYSP